MAMHINDKFFSFPPYLSTSWDHVAALSINESGHIVFHLTSGESAALPKLPPEAVDAIFHAHASYLEKRSHSKRELKNTASPESMDSQIRFAFGSMDGFSQAMQHNPSQSNSPNLPDEVLGKIAQITNILSPEDVQNLPKPEPHCNCYHCQIARAISTNLQKSIPEKGEILIEENVSDKDLHFEQWEIHQTGDKLYNVVNKLDPNEKYSVYLGHPVGCTCGKAGCEHILAVLNS